MGRHRPPALVAALILTVAACDRDKGTLRATIEQIPIGQAGSARSRPASFRPRGSFGRPWQLAGEQVEDQLRAAALDSARCLSRRAIKCGPLEIVGDDFQLDSAILRGDSALIVVQYTVLGWLEPLDSVLQFTPRTDSLGRRAVDTVVVVHESGGWRHVSGATKARVSVRLVALFFELPERDRKALLTTAHLDEQTLRRAALIDPGTLTKLPVELRDTLTNRGCRVPQDPPSDTYNLAHGSFFAPNGNDWAVFCVWSDSGRIFVFRDGGGAPVVVLRPINVVAPDLVHLPDPFPMAGGPFGCTGVLFTEAAVGRWVSKGVRAAAGQLTAEERAAPLHDAIGDAACEKLSSFHYWTGKRWIELPGER